MESARIVHFAEVDESRRKTLLALIELATENSPGACFDDRRAARILRRDKPQATPGSTFAGNEEVHHDDSITRPSRDGREADVDDPRRVPLSGRLVSLASVGWGEDAELKFGARGVLPYS